MGILGQFDQTVLDIVDVLPAALRSLMVIITDIGSPFSCMAILVLVILWAYVHKSKRLQISLAVLLLTMPLADILKELIKRTRPDTPYVHAMLFNTYSFPSGHAYASFLVYGFFAYLIFKHMRSPGKWLAGGGLVLLLLLIGVSRIYLGAHFPSDVLGGWLLGAVMLTAIVRFTQNSPRKI